MATAPNAVRAGLTIVANAARAAVVDVSAEARQEPETARAALFTFAPLVVAEYSPASATLAVDWFDELRTEARPPSAYAPTPRLNVTDEDVRQMVAVNSDALHKIEQGARIDFETAFAQAAQAVENEVQRIIADSFRDTITGNVADDPAAVGWRRFARPEACKFCLMLAARGAVYTRETARFAAHGALMNGDRKGGNCMCIAGPAFGGKEIWAEATPMQYVASQKERTPEQRANLRDYLNANFPDAPG